jgi:methionyl aminopeptidase
MDHPLDQNLFRSKDAEKRELDKLRFEDYDDLRRAAEVHRQTRKHAQKWIKPGMKLMDICNEIESTNRMLIEENGLEAGIAFPTGCSINHVAAHYTPNIGD